MITYLASYPRSGNTLLRIMLKEVFGLRTFSKYDDGRQVAWDQRIIDFVGQEPLGGSWQAVHDDLQASAEMHFVKTHDHPEDNAKAIYVVRDPRAAIVSYRHFLGRNQRQPVSIAEIAVGCCAYGGWSEHLAAWKPIDRAETLFLRYEILVSDPRSCIDRIADFIGLPKQGDWDGRIERFQAVNPDFFRAGSNQANLAELSAFDHALIDLLHGDAMRAVGYDVSRGLLALPSELISCLTGLRVRWQDAQARIAEQQVVISGLEIACRERLALIERLDGECRRLAERG